MSDDSVAPADAFAALGDPTRVSIVRALAEHRGERPADPSLPFAALRKRVGVRDSGRFRYHLNELRGIFVEKREEAYALTPAGLEVAGAILAGTYTDRDRLGPVELEGHCPRCETVPVATVADGALEVTCANDHLLFTWGLAPNAVGDATVEELVELATVLASHGVELALEGTCPECYGAMAPAVDADEQSGPSGLAFRADCDTCGAVVAGPLGFAVLCQQPGAAFLERHGRTLRELRLWELAAVVAGGTLAPDTGTHARVALEADDEECRLAVDEQGRVVDVERLPADVSDSE